MTGNGCISFYQSIMNQNDHQNLCLVFMSFRSRSKQCDLFLKKKLQESKAEEETRYVKESHGIVLFFTNFRSKRAATGKLLESTTMSAVWKGFILSSWANSNDLCSEYFSLCQSVPKVIFCMN